ncbi:MAG TPA: ZIP family metal transporter [Gaiellaceae bacterium]|nr:ZIP family metal transporter [Gaiellaceae bacterium]
MATGILLFLFVEVVGHGVEPVEEALVGAANEGGSWSHFFWLASILVVGGIAGLMSLVYYADWLGKQRGKAMLGPGAASAAEFEAAPLTVGLSPAKWLALLIATGIGLHNFSEGLAIGQSAAQDEVSLALLLVIGFGLHNATEGFGIVAPLSGSESRPSWRFLGLLGLIGGGPTFVGTLIGQAYVSEALEIGFLALAAGSILYVVMELMNVNRQLGYKTLVAWGILLGLGLGFGTDFVLEIAGA